jgi:hypothetical protein
MTITTQENCITKAKWRRFGFIGAIVAVLSIFFIFPVFEKSFYTHLLLECSFILLIFSSVYAIDNGKKSVLIVGLFFIIPYTYFDFLSYYHNSFFYMVIADLLSLAFTIYAIFILMRKILHAPLVHVDLIFGALMVYLLSGILWAGFYFLENLINPGSFHGIGILSVDHATLLHVYEQQFNFLYYSFSTLATLGMGDITPLSHLAKSLTAMEAMFGQLFIAIIIAKLVSVWWLVPDKN